VRGEKRAIFDGDCSVYVLRVDGSLELSVTEGVNRQAVQP
jgi:hypothetical protein